MSKAAGGEVEQLQAGAGAQGEAPDADGGHADEVELVALVQVQAQQVGRLQQQLSQVLAARQGQVLQAGRPQVRVEQAGAVVQLQVPAGCAPAPSDPQTQEATTRPILKNDSNHQCPRQQSMHSAQGGSMTADAPYGRICMSDCF